MLKKILLICFPVLMLSLVGCSSDELSREDQVRQFIDNGIQAAENRNTGEISDMLDLSYTDQKGYNKKNLLQLLRAYFFRHKNIHLFSKIREIRFITDNEAEITMYVAMGGQVIADLSALASLRADLYRFELDLVKADGDWLLRSAKWQPAKMHEIH